MVLPDDAALVIKGKKAEHVLDFNKESNQFLSVLFLSKEKELNTVLNKILSRDKYKTLIRDISFYLSLHVGNNGEEELLFTFETLRKDNCILMNFSDWMRTEFHNKSFTYRNNTVYSLETDNGLLYLNYQRGLLLMTYSENLIRRAVNKLVSKEDSTQSAPDIFPDTRNENANICLYVRYRNFIPCLKNKVWRVGGDVSATDILRPFQWSVFDLTVNNKDIFLSGYTTINVSAEASALFTHKNNEIDFLKMLPVNANRIFSIKADRSDDFKKIKPSVQVGEDFFSLTCPVRILTFEIKNDSLPDRYLLIKSEDISETSFHLFNSLISSFADNQYILDTFHTGSILTGHIDLPNFVFTGLGINNHLPQLKYYTVMDDYVIFTNRKESVLKYIDLIRMNKTLKTSVQYQTLDVYFPKEANLFYCYSFRETEKENSNNSVYRYYQNSFRAIRIQFHAQSDSVLASNIVFQLK
jgi:hypothetical protein